MSDFVNEVLRIVVARICQTIGWHNIQSSALDVMGDVLRRYLLEITRLTNSYAIQFGHSQPNIEEVGLAFRDLQVKISALGEYIRCVDSYPVLDIPQFPVSRESHLNFLKPGSKEVVTRPVHVYEHLPPMFPENEESESERVEVKEDVNCHHNGIKETVTSPFKRPADISTTEISNKRPRLILEEEGRPTREISSVMMTTSGFLSPAREGKLPEARTPINTDSPIYSQSNLITSNEERFERKVTKVVKDNRKNDKRRDKIGKELFKPLIEDIGVKKFATMKDVVKLKAMKANMANSNNNINSDVKTTGTKGTILKQNKGHLKNMKNDKSGVQTASVTQQKTITVQEKCVEGKLSSEPDKSKLNIFKKISKVKEDKLDKKDSAKVKDEPVESRESSPDLIIDEADAKNMNQSKLSVMKTLDTSGKQETMEKPHKITSPNEIINKNYNSIKNSPHSDKDFMFDDDLSPPGTPSTPKTPEMTAPSPPPLKLEKELKRKRKDKTKAKKIKTVKHSTNVRKVKQEVIEKELERPKTPNDPINLVKDEPVTLPPPPPPRAMFSLFQDFIPAPGLIPTPLPNHLFSRLPLAASLPKHGFGQPAHIPPVMPVLPFVTPIKPPPIDEILEKTKTDTLSKPDKSEQASVKEKHKKDKKDKIKKKNKKDKIKNKSEKRKLKEEKKEKEKIKKEKKEKKKEKEREHEGSVPKLTLRIGSPRPPTPDVQVARKIMIKPVLKKDEETSQPGPSDTEAQETREPSPELARISALITRPPKLKSSTNVNDTSSNSTESLTVPPLPLHNKLKKSMFRAIPKFKNRDMKRAGEPDVDLNDTFLHSDANQTSYLPTQPAPAPYYLESHGTKEEITTQQQHTSTSPKQSGPSQGRSRVNTGNSKNQTASSGTLAGVKSAPNKQKSVTIKQQSSSIVDEHGNKVWICPGCGGQDDGSPMIGCDDCDAWYHWVCVGIQVPPDDNEDWYCRICIVKKQETLQIDKKKKRKKKEKKEH